jgi:CBS domain-containing protein
MTVSGTISALLSSKKSAVVHSVPPEATVFEAIQKMADHNVGALVVLTGEQLKGVISERDYTRKVALKGKTSKETKVNDILTANVITVTPQSTVDECLRLMTHHRVRHLPVVENGKVVGIVSIGDLVNWIISTQSHMIQQLTSYISGQY